MVVGWRKTRTAVEGGEETVVEAADVREERKVVELSALGKKGY